jgi:hypothetical protein
VRLTAVIALLSGRQRLSRREVRQLLQDLWAVQVLLGGVVCQDPGGEAARAVGQQVVVVSLYETGWRHGWQRAGCGHT